MLFGDIIFRAAESFLPSQLRFGMRRLRAKRVRERSSEDWPVCERNGKAPEAWPGWPNGKEFAFSLSHDVMGPIGLDRCKEVAEIEIEHGFRSSFHFLTDYRYEVPADLVNWLRRNGFEIGIRHPDRHTAFGSSRLSEDEIRKTNRQLIAWGAHGFRACDLSGNLDRLHGLEIEYDTSTRDFDPFARGRRSVQTVFPFWVAKPDPNADLIDKATKNGHGECGGRSKASAGGFMELPSTMATDRDLFLLLGEQSIDIWLHKLRWLSKKGALAMLVTHPDYMCMSGRSKRRGEYPVRLYRDFLNGVQKVYAGRSWPVLPREVARYCERFAPRQARPPRRVAMVAYNYYKFDNRVRRYAETLARRGDKVRVFCIGPVEDVRAGRWGILKGVEFLSLQSRAQRESSKLVYAWRLGCFFWRVMAQLGRRGMPDGCDLLHVHNMPDFLVFAGFRLKFRGTPIILDIHDLVPELLESKAKSRLVATLAALMRWIELQACRFSNHVIVANHLWKKTLLKRSAPDGKVTALINNVDLDLFTRTPRTRSDDRIVLIYPGTLNYHQGVDIAIKGLPRLASEFPRIELHIWGNGSAVQDLKDQARLLQVSDRVRFARAIVLDEVPALLANADIGIVPKRAEGFGGQAYSTKIMEFMSQGLPVVLSRTPIDSFYFDESLVAFFESGNAEDFVRVVRRVVSDRDYRRRLSKQGFDFARTNSWQSMKDVYLDLVDRLTRTGPNRSFKRYTARDESINDTPRSTKSSDMKLEVAHTR